MIPGDGDLSASDCSSGGKKRQRLYAGVFFRSERHCRTGALNSGVQPSMKPILRILQIGLAPRPPEETTNSTSCGARNKINPNDMKEEKCSREQEWKGLNVGQPLSLQETSIERAFLVMHCPLDEVVRHLPILKKAVSAANEAYEEYARRQAADQKNREDVWKNEREAVEHVAKSLHFD